MRRTRDAARATRAKPQASRPCDWRTRVASREVETDAADGDRLFGMRRALDGSAAGRRLVRRYQRNREKRHAQLAALLPRSVCGQAVQQVGDLDRDAKVVRVLVSARVAGALDAEQGNVTDMMRREVVGCRGVRKVDVDTVDLARIAGGVDVLDVE